MSVEITPEVLATLVIAIVFAVAGQSIYNKTVDAETGSGCASLTGAVLLLLLGVVAAMLILPMVGGK